MGNACRELRRTDESIAHLEASLGLAESLRDRRLEGNAAMSLAASLSFQGDFARSLESVDRAIDLLEGDDRVVAMSQRGGVLLQAGRHSDALEAFGAALEAASDVEDQTIRGDIWVNRGVLLGFVGNIEEAATDTQRALDLFEEMGWHKRAADQRHNLAWLAGRGGDLVDALRRFDDAEEAYEKIGLTSESIFPDRCEVLTAAGLATEALALAEASARAFTDQGNDVDAAESLLLVARAALLANDPERALRASDEASERFGRQDREGWHAHAVGLELEARIRMRRVDESDRDRAIAIAAEAAEARLGSVAAAGMVVAAEIALTLGDLTACATDLASVDTDDLSMSDRFRFTLVSARLAASMGQPQDALELCADGFRDFTEMSAALGGTELRAHVAQHVDELVDYGVSLALEAADPALVLEWAERQRASVLSAPPVLPPADHDLERELNLLRSAIAELEECVEQGLDTRPSRDRCARAQDRVRRRTRHVHGSKSVSQTEPSSGLPVFVESGDELHSIGHHGGDLTVANLGSFSEVQRRVGLLQSTLAMHLGAVGRGVDRGPAAVLADAAALDEVLFPNGGLSGGRAVICPTSGIYDLPWGLLPTLSATAFALAPSIETYRRCAATADAAPRKVAAIAGPDLRFADGEVTALCAAYPSSDRLLADAATVGDAKALVRGADVAHFACHGRFAAGNPMFSSLQLRDGGLFVHEIERIRPAPRIAVLSACHAGLHSSPTGQESLGLTTSLLAGGSRTVVAATVPVPDTVSTVELMTSFHAGLVEGVGAAAALRDVRREHPVLGGAFSCHGAG